jgi:hypothetical protein
MPLEFTGEDLQQLTRMRVAVAAALRPFAHNTEAAIAVAACITNARVLIDKYPPERRAALVEACVLFLNHETPDQSIIPFDITGGRGGGPRILKP